MGRKVPPLTRGGYFLITTTDGRVWNGEGWTRDWDKAQQFRPPAGTYEMVEEARARALSLTGEAGINSFVPD